MTERGLPPEGAPACPFVAFEDDRDGRSTAPDHRHRCFAEPRPAPRALAHQEAYCLSSAFPVCPTFQDWARREAAAARSATPAAQATRDEPPQSRPMPPLDREGRHVTDTPPAAPPRRSPQRSWAAPPPWSADAPGADTDAGAPTTAATGRPPTPPDPDPDLGPDPGPDPDAYDPYAPGAPAVREPDRLPADWGDESQGLAGSAAHRLAGADLAYVPDERDEELEAWAAGAGAGAYVAGAATARDQSRYAPPSRRQPAPSRRDRRRDEPRRTGQDQVRRPAGQEAQELFGPAWEPARRYEAYPSLRTRIGLPSVRGLPRVAVWALVLLAIAFFVFLFGPRLLGLGGADDPFGAGATPTPVATEEATASLEPTEPPAPTPRVHIVAKGETMSRIARKYGVTVEEIMAVNPRIKNPNRIQIGDQITIPVPEPETGFEEDSAAP